MAGFEAAVAGGAIVGCGTVVLAVVATDAATHAGGGAARLLENDLAADFVRGDDGAWCCAWSGCWAV